jgi:hypothetical protein
MPNSVAIVKVSYFRSTSVNQHPPKKSSITHSNASAGSTRF